MSRKQFKSGFYSERGFGLIEAMLAVVLLAIGVLAIASGEVQSITMNKRTHDAMKAMTAADNMVELVRRNSEFIDAYGGLNTTVASTTIATTTAGIDRQTIVRDFQAFQNEITTELAGSSEDTFACGANQVSRSCGSITVANSRLGDVAPDARDVTINVVWPGNPNGIFVKATVIR